MTPSCTDPGALFPNVLQLLLGSLASKKLFHLLEFVVSKARPEDAYQALRDLLRTRVTSPHTRRQAQRAVQQMHNEALSAAILAALLDDDGEDSSEGA